MELAGHRLGKFSLGVRRLFVGIAGVPCLLTVANLYLKWGLFGRFDRGVMAASFALLFLVMRYLGPTVQEIRDYRNKANAR